MLARHSERQNRAVDQDRDGATLPLHFEPRLIDLHIDKEAIDQVDAESDGGALYFLINPKNKTTYFERMPSFSLAEFLSNRLRS